MDPVGTLADEPPLPTSSQPLPDELHSFSLWPVASSVAMYISRFDKQVVGAFATNPAATGFPDCAHAGGQPRSAKAIKRRRSIIGTLPRPLRY
jgi:hypothetical protein